MSQMLIGVRSSLADQITTNERMEWCWDRYRSYRLDDNGYTRYNGATNALRHIWGSLDRIRRA